MSKYFNRRRIMAFAFVVVASMTLLTESEAQAKSILVLGDSISAEYGLARGTGWVALLEARLSKEKKPFSVVNASISGETTSGGLTRLKALLEKHSPAIVVIELGGNDALRGLPLMMTRSNLEKMTELSQAIGAKVVIAGMEMPPNYGQYAKQFKAMFSEVASAKKAALVPFVLAGFGEKPEYFQADKIHPTAAAQPMILENVWGGLKGLIK